tara:strand:+ start:168 stop:1871 length:1704 start_codon:yes stop_codon:yes gene_type:complete
MAKNFVRGGQLHLHNLRMIKQVMSVGLVISLIIGGGVFVWKAWDSIPSHLIRQYVSSYHAEFYLPFKHASKEHLFTVSWPEENYDQQVRAIDIVNHPYTHDLRNHVNGKLKDQIEGSLIALVISLFSLLLFWALKGRSSFKSKRLRGQILVSSQKLKRMIYLRRQASDLKIDSLPLIRGSETKHLLAVGTTGAGKTNIYDELLPQIEKRKNKALVIDMTGEMISKYYKPERGDIIINPFDRRSSDWDIVNECEHEYEYDNLAKSIVPKNSEYSDPLWQNGAATLFSVGLQKAKDEGISPKELHKILIQSSLKEFGAFFEGTDAFPFANPKAEKTTLSFVSTLSSSVQFLKHLGSFENKVLLREWVRDETAESWIFITSNTSMRSTLNPLVAAIFNAISSDLMSLKRDGKRRLWFIMDELPALQKLRFLQPLLSEGRKYGGCVFAGLQGTSQFEENYGVNGARTILNLFNTKFFFRCEEIQATEQVSKWLGEEEVEEAKESVSYGAHQMRDGKSINMQRSIRRLVLPTEIGQLDDLTCYLKFPGKLPIAKHKMAYNDIKVQHEEFELI